MKRKHRNEKQNKMIKKLFSKKAQPIIIDINPCKEALFILRTIKTDKSIIKEFENKLNFTNKNLKQIEKIIFKKLNYIKYLF